MTVVGSAEIVISPLLADFDRRLTEDVTTATKAAPDVAVPVMPVLNDSGFSDLLTEIADTAAQDRVEVPVTPVLDNNGVDIFAKQVQGATDEVAKGGSKLGDVFSGIGTQAISVLEQRFAGLAAKGTSALSQIGVAANALPGPLKAIAVAIGATLGALAFANKSIGVFADLASEVRAFGRVTGSSAEEASTMVAALHRLGVEPEAVSRSLSRLSASLATGKDALAKYGIETVVAADGNVDLIETFLSIADRVEELGPGLQANALAAEVFGQRMATQLLPVLLKGRDGIEELRRAAANKGLIFTDEDLDKARQFGAAQKDLGEAFQAFEIQIGRVLIPTFSNFLKGLVRLVEMADDVAGALTSMIPEPLRRALSWVLDHLGANEDAASGLADANEFLSGTFDGLGDALEDPITKMERMIEAQTSLLDLNLQVEAANRQLTASQDRVTDAENRLAEVRHGTPAELKAQEAATRSLTEANEENAKVQADLAKLQRTETKRAAELVEKANLAMERATDSLQDAIEDEADAQRELNEARAAGGDPEKLAQAEERIADAVSNVAKARRELAIAESRVIAGRDAKSIADSVEANARVAEANERVREAEEAEAKARQEQDAVRAEGADFIHDKEEKAEDASRRVRDAQLDIADATDQVTEAQRQQREGTDELVATQEKAEDAAKKVKDATDKLREANEALIPTAEELKEAQDNLKDAHRDVELAAIDVAKANADLRTTQAEANGETVTAIERQQALREELLKVADALGDNSPLAQNLRSRATELKSVATNAEEAQKQLQRLRIFEMTPEAMDPEEAQAIREYERSKNPNPASRPFIEGGGSTSGGGGGFNSAGMRPIINIYETTSPRETGREAVRALKAWSDVAVGR